MSKLENISVIEEVFPIYVECFFSKSKRAYEFWNMLTSNNQCYIFGGFIVDFLNKKNKHRDIDIVIDYLNEDIIQIIKQFGGIKNSFGGYKIVIENIVIDLWAIRDTWALKKMNYLDFDLFSILPSTSFYNSTAIIYSISNKKLIFKKEFEKFFFENTIDIMFEENPFPELCIIKSYSYYLDGFNLSNKLKSYINRKFFLARDKMELIQIKHFGEIKYSLQEIECFNKSIGLNTMNRNSPKYIHENYSKQLMLFSY